MSEAREMLDLAARLALRGWGRVEPNPMVGAVIVRDGPGPARDRLIGLGHHTVFGGLHAEAEALADCRRRGHDPRGATVYCTLEPCNHHGKQPPCTTALIGAGVDRVVCGRRDPNPVSTGGEAALTSAGIPCSFDDSSPLARRASDPFIKRVTTGLPWVIAKWAQSIDGRIAARTGDSKWISGRASRQAVHRVRGRVDVVLTAIGTVLADDPLLTARLNHCPRRVARRVVIDPGLETPVESQLIATAMVAPLTIATTEAAMVHRGAAARRLADAGAEVLAAATDGAIPLEPLLRHMVSAYDATNVLVEGGAGLLGRLFAADLVDEAMVFIAPILLGDDDAIPVARGREIHAIADATRFTTTRVKRLGDDVGVHYARIRQDLDSTPSVG